MPTYCLSLAAMLFIKLPLIEPSKMDYCKIMKSRHFLCEGKTIETERVCFNNTFVYPINDRERNDSLKALNDIRAGVANGSLQIGHPKFRPPQAANMYQLKWDTECEKAARNIVKHCGNLLFYGHSSNIFARFETGLYLDKDFNLNRNNIPTVADLLWYRIKGNDKRFHDIVFVFSSGYTIKRMSPFYKSKLALLLIAEVSVVGCAMVLENSGSKITGNLACVFAGITTWDTPLILYENGPKCSICPAESQCSKEYDSLCECKKRCYSYSRDVLKSGFYDSYAIAVDRETKEDVIVPLKDIDNGSHSYISYFRYLNSTPILTNFTSIASATTTTEALIVKTTSVALTIKAANEALAIKTTDINEDGHEENFDLISSEPSPYYIAITILAAEIVTTFVR